MLTVTIPAAAVTTRDHLVVGADPNGQPITAAITSLRTLTDGKLSFRLGNTGVDKRDPDEQVTVKARPRDRFRVVCDCHTSEPLTASAAERRLTAITEIGVCGDTHRIELAV